MSLMSPALGGRFFTTSITWESLEQCLINIHISYYYYLPVIVDAFQGFPKLGFCTQIEHFGQNSETSWLYPKESKNFSEQVNFVKISMANSLQVRDQALWA